MATTAPIKVPILGVDLFSKNFQKITQKVQAAGQKMTAMGRGLTTAVTLPIVGFAVASGKVAMEFDDSMRGVQAKAKETSVSIAQLREQAKKLGRETRFKASEAAAGMEKLAMAGWNTGQIFDGIGGILSLAAASGSDLAQSAEVTANTMGAFNMQAKESSHMADVIAATLTGANVDMDTYADSMRYASTVAKDYRMSIEDTSAAVGFLGNVGIKGSQAGTALRKMMLQLSTGSGGAAKQLKKLGVETVDKTTGNMRNLFDVLRDVNKAMDDKGFKDPDRFKALDKLFGIRAITGASAMAGNLKDVNGSFSQLIKALNDLQPGKAKAMAEIMEGGAGGAWRRAASAFEAVQLAFAESGMLDMAARALERIAEVLRSFANKDPEFLMKIAKGAAGLAAVGPALMLIGKLVSGIGTLMSYAPQAVKFFRFLASRGAAATGIGAAVVAIIAFRRELMPTFRAIRDFVVSALKEWKDAMGFGGGTGVTGAIDGMVDSLRPIVSVIEPIIRTSIRLGLKIMSIPWKISLKFVGLFKTGLRVVTKIVRLLTKSLHWLALKLVGASKKFLESHPRLKAFVTWIKEAFKWVSKLGYKMSQTFGWLRGKAFKALGLGDGLDGFLDTEKGLDDAIKDAEADIRRMDRSEVKVKIAADEGTRVKRVETKGQVSTEAGDFFGANMAGDMI